MEGPEHYFLHEHPIIYNDDQQESWCCSACGLPLLLSPSYRCNNDCNFFLHKSCRQLPQQLNYVARNGLDCYLALIAKPPNEAWPCDVCGELCKNLIAYHSSKIKINPPVRFRYEGNIVYVDALCAFPLEIKSKHDSHEHELVAMRREAQLLCDVCGRQHKGFFFSCKEQSCDFWIHKDCALLPRILDSTFHDHVLAFSYSALGEIFPMDWKYFKRCLICKELFSHTAAYYCTPCEEIVHLNCVISTNKNTGYQPSQFPLEEADKSLFIYTMLDKKRIENNKEDEKLSIEKYHNHPNLIFHDSLNIDKDYSSSSSSKYYSLYCDACIQPINSPSYYSCQEPGCNFLLHDHCKKLPSKINLEFLGSAEYKLALELKLPMEIFSIFDCDFCWQKCSGFIYKGTNGTIHIECASIPRSIKHQLHHKQHILCLISHFSVFELPFACCSDNRYFVIGHPVYKCTSCNFKIHVRCALLPAKVSHKFDKHPLQLSSKRHTNVNNREHYICEICEGNIDMRLWFYQCLECDQFFHIECIPSVGSLSKIKFGGTVVIRCHHSDHPVTLTRMLDIGNQRCGECKEIIQGFVDDMAFQCSKCWYWIHFDCVKEARML